VALRLALVIAGAACLIEPRPAHGQSITAEAALTGGYSTDDVMAAATQLRVFGDVKGGIRFFGEAAWAGRSLSDLDHESDSFNAAYPYTNRVQIIEAYGERLFRPHDALVGVRGGRFRPPFGIYNASDHAYSGFLRAPLVRYEEYSLLSNNQLEQGADLVVGIPRFTVEAALGAPGDVGEVVRRSGLDTVVRAQGYYGPLIAGVSYMRTQPSQTAPVTDEHNHVTGVDLRWTHAGVQLRGEWVSGHPFGTGTSIGWYADAIVHRTIMGPVTAVLRVERLDFQDVESGSDEYLSRQTIGARVNLGGGIALQVNALHQSGDEDYPPLAFDVAVTWSVRKP
jgi:hypothetical protein